MTKYKISYYYLATGMEGMADEYPERNIEVENPKQSVDVSSCSEKVVAASSRDMAIYQYLVVNDIEKGSFTNFMKQEKWIREWGISCEEL